MKMELCSRCKKRMAVVFVTRFDGEKTVNEGICLRCAKELGIKRSEVVFALDAICDPVSLYEPVYSDSGENVCVMDQIGDERNTDEHWLEQIALGEAVAKLSDREKRILAMRFSSGKTQMEVAREIGISQAQVSRLEKNAINRIKKEIQ